MAAVAAGRRHAVIVSTHVVETVTPSLAPPTPNGAMTS